MRHYIRSNRNPSVVLRFNDKKSYDNFFKTHLYGMWYDVYAKDAYKVMRECVRDSGNKVSEFPDVDKLYACYLYLFGSDVAYVIDDSINPMYEYA